jgi:hypothetical protein
MSWNPCVMCSLGGPVVNWTLSLDILAEPIAFYSPDACRWCIQGWLRKTNAPLPIWDRVNEIARSNGFVSAIAANDTLGYEFVKLLREECDK